MFHREFKSTWFLPTNRRLGVLVAAAALIGSGVSAYAIVSSLTLVGDLHESQAEHVDQLDLLNLVKAGDHHEAFEMAFELGDELFETRFNALDGVGANVGDGSRFSRVPRADLNGPGEWAQHFPPRATGPNAQACNECHDRPSDDGGGSAASAVHRDPFHSASLGMLIRRDTPHVFAPGALQRLAEEMTEELHAIRDEAADTACDIGRRVTRRLTAKGVEFGHITADPERRRRRGRCRVDFRTGNVEGVDRDLVVRPFQWKGNFSTVRAFNRDASHNELGMQAVEITGKNVDGDGDGVVNEMTIGDQTALAVYLASQPRPTTKTELASYGLIPALPAEEVTAIARGREVFENSGCTSCHVPSMTIDNPIFSEPSQNPNYRDATFPSGLDPIAEGVDPDFAVTFDLTQDQPDNVIEDDAGNVIYRLGSLQTNAGGQAVVEAYGDLKRHYMGERLAEQIDETGSGAAVFITKELWGVGNTGPWLHDGRATTLTEAIQEHGGEARSSREAFEAAPLDDQQALIAFLNNLVLFKMPEEEDPPAAGAAPIATNGGVNLATTQ